ncbi:MAG: hypothetical protein COB14_00480 [Alphaproteobacteria bacterium]|nr:MAG: hypothetical protein COB14_00480 [Alphaproteobacteria bacterium]
MKDALRNQSGNALWFILLAVALLAFLTGVISRNSSSVDQAGSVERARIKASSILNYAKSVEATVQQMLLSGVSENDLDFIEISAAHDNTNCTSTECEIFHVGGGGIAYRTPAALLSDNTHTDIWHVSTENRVYLSGCEDANNRCTELLLIATNIPQSICLQINKIQGITNTGGDAPQIQDILEGTAFTGTYSTTVNTISIGGVNATNEAPEAQGKAAGCVYEFGSGQNIYTFYQVLIPR